jgi:hypothetical protein
MINGAWLKTYDQAVLCSNDSDLEGALRSIKEHHPHIHASVWLRPFLVKILEKFQAI